VGARARGGAGSVRAVGSASEWRTPGGCESGPLGERLDVVELTLRGRPVRHDLGTPWSSSQQTPADYRGPSPGLLSEVVVADPRIFYGPGKTSRNSSNAPESRTVLGV
jgi:hypothetical protein